MHSYINSAEEIAGKWTVAMEICSVKTRRLIDMIPLNRYLPNHDSNFDFLATSRLLAKNEQQPLVFHQG